MLNTSFNNMCCDFLNLFIIVVICDLYCLKIIGFVIVFKILDVELHMFLEVVFFLVNIFKSIYVSISTSTSNRYLDKEFILNKYKMLKML